MTTRPFIEGRIRILRSPALGGDDPYRHRLVVGRLRQRVTVIAGAVLGESRYPILPAMRSGKSDTPREVEALIIQGYRRMTPREKLERVDQLNRSVRSLALAGIRQRYGTGLAEREQRLRLAALSIDRETMLRACEPWPSTRRMSSRGRAVARKAGATRRCRTRTRRWRSSERCLG